MKKERQIYEEIRKHQKDLLSAAEEEKRRICEEILKYQRGLSSGEKLQHKEDASMGRI